MIWLWWVRISWGRMRCWRTGYVWNRWAWTWAWWIRSDGCGRRWHGWIRLISYCRWVSSSGLMLLQKWPHVLEEFSLLVIPAPPFHGNHWCKSQDKKYLWKKINKELLTAYGFCCKVRYIFFIFIHVVDMEIINVYSRPTVKLKQCTVGPITEPCIEL